jgi:hypothetical protein
VNVPCSITLSACAGNVDQTGGVDRFEIDNQFEFGLLLYGKSGASNPPNYLSTRQVTCAT